MKNLTFFALYLILFGGLFSLEHLQAKNDYPPQYVQVKVQGNANGKNLILIPGLACAGTVWEETVAQLEKEYRCHILTLPGFGGNKAITQRPFLQTVKEDIIQYIEQNKLGKVTLVGHSLGGFLSLQIAHQKPQLIEKLIIVDALPFLTAIFMPNATEESAKPMAENMRTQMKNPTGTAEQMTANQRRNLKTLIRDSVYVEKALEWGLKSDAATVADAMYEMYSTDFREEVAQIPCPTLVLGAAAFTKQYNIPYNTAFNNYNDQYKTMPNYQLELNVDAQHFIMYDAPQWFYEQVKTFLKK